MRLYAEEDVALSASAAAATEKADEVDDDEVESCVSSAPLSPIRRAEPTLDIPRSAAVAFPLPCSPFWTIWIPKHDEGQRVE